MKKKTALVNNNVVFVNCNSVHCDLCLKVVKYDQSLVFNRLNTFNCNGMKVQHCDFVAT